MIQLSMNVKIDIVENLFRKGVYMTLNDIKFGFKIDRIVESEETGSTAYYMTHNKTGAELLFLKNEDENKTFGIGFKTPPTDSTGVAHIVEHSVLSGSRNF